MSSKFKNVLTAARERDPEPMPSASAPAVVVEPAAKPVGRPKNGKRSNPDYEQVTAYVKKQTYTDVRIALLQEGGAQEFSDLVQELLNDWLQARP